MNIEKKNNSTINFKLKPKVSIPKNLDNKADADAMDFVLKHKSRQFVLDCGVIMARIDANIKNVFSLSYHFERTKSFDDFITSINTALSVISKKLTPNDIKKLRHSYENRIKKMVENKSISQEIVDKML